MWPDDKENSEERKKFLQDRIENKKTSKLKLLKWKEQLQKLIDYENETVSICPCLLNGGYCSDKLLMTRKEYWLRRDEYLNNVI